MIKTSSRKSERWPHSLFFSLYFPSLVFPLFSPTSSEKLLSLFLLCASVLSPSRFLSSLVLLSWRFTVTACGIVPQFFLNGYIDPETQCANTVLSGRARGRRGRAAGDAGKQKACAESLISTHHFPCVCSLLPVKGFDTEEQFERFVQTDPHSENVLAAVVFEHPFTHDDEPLPLKVKVSMRPPEAHPSTSTTTTTTTTQQRKHVYHSFFCCILDYSKLCNPTQLFGLVDTWPWCICHLVTWPPFVICPTMPRRRHLAKWLHKFFWQRRHGCVALTWATSRTGSVSLFGFRQHSQCVYFVVSQWHYFLFCVHTWLLDLSVIQKMLGMSS